MQLNRLERIKNINTLSCVVGSIQAGITELIAITILSNNTTAYIKVERCLTEILGILNDFLIDIRSIDN